MTQFTESSVVQADYTYNAQGQRVKKVRHVGASDYVRHFFYDPAGRLIGEYRDNPDGSYAYVDYVWLNGAPLVQEARSYNSSDVLTGTQTTWLHVDHLNTPRVGTNDSKVIVWRWDSDPFGVGAADSDPDNDSTDHVVLLRFPGQYEDEESGHYYNYFRDYDSATGRYVESDPIGLAGGLNTYGYSFQNPIRYTDPTGRAVPAAAAAIEACLASPYCASAVAGAFCYLANCGETLAGVLSDPVDPAQQTVDEASATGACEAGNNGDDCAEVIARIRRHVELMKDKWNDLATDPYDLFNQAYNSNPGGPLRDYGTYRGHVGRYEGLRKGLGRMIRLAQQKGCVVPAEAYEWLYKPAPLLPYL